MNILPMLRPDVFPADDPDGFATSEELVEYFEKCLRAVNPPIRTNIEVYKIRQLDSGYWAIYTDNLIYRAKNVAICIGAMCTPKIPLFAENIAHSIPQIHSSQYKSPEQITTGSVLLVGSGSSGVQIANLLCQSRRFDQIYIAESNVFVLPPNILEAI